MKLAAPAKVLTMALLEGKSVLIAGTADRHIQFFDLRAGTATKKRESTLKHQTRFIRAFPDEAGYIIGSIEGRCGVEFVEDGEHASKKYAFKCHRTPDPAHPGEDRIFPVNACAFHPVYGTFATGGGDGTVLMWDYKAKKRLCRVRECETSVSSLAFNRCGISGREWIAERRGLIRPAFRWWRRRASDRHHRASQTSCESPRSPMWLFFPLQRR